MCENELAANRSLDGLECAITILSVNWFLSLLALQQASSFIYQTLVCCAPIQGQTPKAAEKHPGEMRPERRARPLDREDKRVNNEFQSKVTRATWSCDKVPSEHSRGGVFDPLGVPGTGELRRGRGRI